MPNIFGVVKHSNGKLEDDKRNMRILKSQRITIFVVIILVVIIDINEFLTHETSFWMGMFSGVVGITCLIGLFINFRLSKRIGKRLKKELKLE